MSQQISSNKTVKICCSVKFLSILFIILLAAVSSKAAGEVDPTFNPVPLKEYEHSWTGNFALQPDGKIIVFSAIGSSYSSVQRLNSDGSSDASFNCVVCNIGGEALIQPHGRILISSVLVQPDGKILIGGSLFPIIGFSSSKALVIRINPDGSQDLTFAYPLSNEPHFSASVKAVQPDGKILIAVRESGNNGSTVLSVRRLNPDGSFDNSFTPISAAESSDYFYTTNLFSKILLLGDGKILTQANISSSNGSITATVNRYNSDGTRDASFQALEFTDSFDNRARVDDFEILPDGNLLVAGDFTSVGGVQRRNIAKLLPSGNVDTSFAPQIDFSVSDYVSSVRLLPNGQFLILVNLNNRIVRLNANGTVDNSFTPPTSISNINAWMVDSQNRILIVGYLGNKRQYFRLNADGGLDQTFNNFVPLVPGSVRVIGLQPDNKAIVYGNFIKMNGVSRNNLARLNTDGTTDPTFDARNGFNGQVNVIVVQPDGRILVGGKFTSFNGEPRVGLARLLSDGNLDNTFTANLSQAGEIHSIALQPDGRILVGGAFTGINGTARNALARLNSNGTVDTTFNAVLNGGTIRAIVSQADGKVLIGGLFTSVNNVNRLNLVRLNSDGSVDNTFNAGSIAEVKLIQQQADGKYVVVTINTFVTYNNPVIRLNNNGNQDYTFLSPPFYGEVNSILVEPTTGAVLVGGRFYHNHNSSLRTLARLKPGGGSDTSFSPIAPNGEVYTLVRQSDGKTLVGGIFTQIGNTTRYGIARIAINPFRNITPYDFDGDGRADFTVYRPESGYWFIINSSNNSFTATQFGVSTDLIAPADYDGDGRTDIAVFRPRGAEEPNQAYFYILESRTNRIRAEQFGIQGDVPVSGDWDGDGIADLAVYRDASQTGGQSYFFYRPSTQPGTSFATVHWGRAGDKPVAGDYTGDGKFDAAVVRSIGGYWYWYISGFYNIGGGQFGLSTDIPTPIDLDGDGALNRTVYRPSNGTWYTSPVLGMFVNNTGGVQWGIPTDIPVAADYDGDGNADLAVYRPQSGSWYVFRSMSGFMGTQWGTATDKPAPSAYVR